MSKLVLLTGFVLASQWQPEYPETQAGIQPASLCLWWVAAWSKWYSGFGSYVHRSSQVRVSQIRQAAFWTHQELSSSCFCVPVFGSWDMWHFAAAINRVINGACKKSRQLWFCSSPYLVGTVTVLNIWSVQFSSIILCEPKLWQMSGGGTVSGEEIKMIEHASKCLRSN